jgi:hypothetical protein
MTLPADITVTIAVAPQRKVWANSTRFASGDVTKNGGCIDTHFSVHSALAISLTSALGFLSHRKWKQFDGTILITSEDRLFLQGIDALVSGHDVKTLRAARALWSPLRKSLNRGRIVTRVVPVTDGAVLSLKGWAVNRLVPRLSRPRVFTPSLATEQTVAQRAIEIRNH